MGVPNPELVHWIKRLEERIVDLEAGGGGGGAGGDHPDSDHDHGGLQGLGDDDHGQYVLENILTAKGSIYGASAASTPAERTVGTDGQLLSADSAGGAERASL